MPVTVTTFDAAVPPSRAFAFLSNPRNHMFANNDGPVVEQSAGPFGAGAWFVLKFDQLRARVEYTVVEPDRRIAAVITMSGLGSGGQVSRFDYTLMPLDEGSRTRVDLTADRSGGCLRWGPFVRSAQSATTKRLREKMEAAA
ncbi:MAG TPA: SRPBCC family protein [Candidatus Limnocylindrales bacterium]